MTVLTTPDHREYLTVAEVAAELHCSEPTVRRRIRSGELPAVRLGERTGTAVRVRRGDLERVLCALPTERPHGMSPIPPAPPPIVNPPNPQPPITPPKLPK